MNRIIEVDGEREDNVIGIHWMPIGETDTTAQIKGIHTAVRGHVPGSRESRACLQRSPVDVNEVCVQVRDHILRWHIDRRERIKRFRFSALSSMQPSAMLPRYPRITLQVLRPVTLGDERQRQQNV